tara:strand:- start:2 stop:1261 length:1260 start_codon:yes stop_codon:yes gene_type:complete
MLYQIYEINRSLMSPFVKWAKASSKLLTDPISPFSHAPFAQPIAAGYELLYRLGKDYYKPFFGIESIESDFYHASIREDVVFHKSFCKLIHFKKGDIFFKTKKIIDQPIVLLVAPLSGHHATLLRDTVKTLLIDYDVYVTDWIDARMIPLEAGTFHLEDYIFYIQDFIRYLGPKINVISVCQPTVPVLAAISLMSSQDDPNMPSSMVMMGGPIDPRRSPTEVNDLALNKSFSWFEKNMIHKVPTNYPGFNRKVYPGFLQHMGFVAMNPKRHAESHWNFYLHLREGENASTEDHIKFYDEYNSVLDMPAEYYLDTIKTVFQDFALPKGNWIVGGNLVRPKDIKKVSLFTIEGEFDDISGLGQTEAAHDLCTGLPNNMKFHFTAPKCGHYGIFSGRRWRELISPKVSEFIKKFSSRTVKLE